MGLDTSHNCWHGAYSAFMTWREKIAEVSGLPPLILMEGFLPPYIKTGFESIDRQLPIKWDCIRVNVGLKILLTHSDCDGIIKKEECDIIADDLEKILHLLPPDDAPGHIGNWQKKTQQFIDGLRAASQAGEDVDFH